jgi:hypothetical protein
MQKMLRRARIAVIDTVMAVEGEWAPDEEQAEAVQRELERVAAHYDDLLGKSNAISAECRGCLALWLALKAPEAAREALRAQFEQHVGTMAKALVGGTTHMLVAAAWRGRFGALELPTTGRKARQRRHGTAPQRGE